MTFRLKPIYATFIAGILTFAYSVMAIGENVPSSESSEEEEIGINISKSGYDKLKRGFDWEKETKRTDYYFDAFDGKSFVLVHLSTPYKLRLKNKEDGLFLQFSHPIQRETITVQGVPLYVRRTKAEQIQCSQSFGEQLISTINRYFANLDIGGAKLLAAAEDFNKVWYANANEISTKVKSVLTNTTAKIVPTQENMKERLTLKCKLAGVKFKLFLEDKRARNNNGDWLHVYGVEAEPRSTYKHEDMLAAAKALGELVANKGLNTADLRSDNPDATEFTLKQLMKK